MNAGLGLEAKFKIVKELTIIDCSVNHSLTPLYFDVNKGFYEPDEPEREKAVWAHIDQAFSRPVTSNENQAHYEEGRGSGLEKSLFRQMKTYFSRPWALGSLCVSELK